MWTFRAIEHEVAAEIQTYYQASLPGGEPAQALYYFWVKQAPCPRCRENVDLFSSYVFADHAYRDRYPHARVLCPRCGAVNTTRNRSATVTCETCGHSFDPRSGPARGTKATCPRCSECFAIARAVREQGTPPSHRLYAKLVGAAHQIGSRDAVRRSSAWGVTPWRNGEDPRGEGGPRGAEQTARS